MRLLMTSALLVTTLLTSSLSLALETGDKAPAFKLPQLTQKGQISLASYKGKVVYVDFWASWCGPCRKSLPMLNELRAELKGQGFEVLAINLDEDVKDARAFLKEFPVSYPTLYDGDGKTPTAFGLRGMPTSYLIDRQGRIQSVHQGFKPSDISKIRAEVIQQLQQK
ncbi:MAG: TlpA family protein disulfide reductase [Saccharospirillaceae bacterium]|nr:TlpA family protein disulfide reductase [Saccharospirillaceae bacterium]MCD8531210.1 TlpA family protein disulfide reductase [Saccharospirillaceae bacterium]